jgi:hypothetical protein
MSYHGPFDQARLGRGRRRGHIENGSRTACGVTRAARAAPRRLAPGRLTRELLHSIDDRAIADQRFIGITRTTVWVRVSIW